MISPDVLAEYKRIRAKVWTWGSNRRVIACLPKASEALHEARTNIAWDAAESAGLVRVRQEPDDAGCEPDWGEGCYPRKCEGDRARKEWWAKVKSDGIWLVVTEYRLTDDDPWEHADSCGGFVGDDWKGSGYDTDMKASALKALADARADAADAQAVRDFLFP